MKKLSENSEGLATPFKLDDPYFLFYNASLLERNIKKRISKAENYTYENFSQYIALSFKQKNVISRDVQYVLQREKLNLKSMEYTLQAEIFRN